jgi:hypothetical protein
LRRIFSLITKCQRVNALNMRANEPCDVAPAL